MRHILDFLSRPRFQVPAESLASFRFLFCLAMSINCLLETVTLIDLYNTPNAVYNAIPPFIALSIGQISLEAVVAIGVLLILTLCAASIGILPRQMFIVASILYFLFSGTNLGFSKPLPSEIDPYTFHYDNAALFTLMLLSVFATDSDKVASQFFHTLKLMLGLVYFATFYTKVTQVGWGWADGYSLQAFIFESAISYDMRHAFWIANQYSICLVLSIVTLFFEATFIAVPFFERSCKHFVSLFALIGICFHLGIALVMHILHFLPYMCLLYLIFPLSHPAIASHLAKVPKRIRQTLLRRSAPLFVDMEKGYNFKFINVLVVVTMLICIGIRAEQWPFSDFGVFVTRKQPLRVSATLGRLVNDRGQAVWIGDGLHGIKSLYHSSYTRLARYYANKAYLSRKREIDQLDDDNAKQKAVWQHLRQAGRDLTIEYIHGLPIKQLNRYSRFELVQVFLRQSSTGYDRHQIVVFSTSLPGKKVAQRTNGIDFL